MDVRARARDDSAAADAQRARGVEALGVSGARLRQDRFPPVCSARRSSGARSRCRRRIRGASSSSATPVAGSRRRTTCSRRATTPRNGRSPPSPPLRPPPRRISSSTSATTTIARTSARRETRDAPEVRGAMAGTRGRPTSSRPGSRCSRRRRGSSFAAITNRAIAPARAGGDSSIRVRLRPRRNCNAAADDAIGDYSEPYAVPLGSGRDADTQFIVFDSSLVGVAPLPADDPMHVRYRAQFERRSRSPRGGRTRSS